MTDQRPVQIVIDFPGINSMRVTVHYNKGVSYQAVGCPWYYPKPGFSSMETELATIRNFIEAGRRTEELTI